MQICETPSVNVLYAIHIKQPLCETKQNTNASQIGYKKLNFPRFVQENLQNVFFFYDMSSSQLFLA